uniref:BTB domain-containing protein n=1 Tax=Panagrolaimus davidi TaxID=227884 RepID=A0A914Q4R2_9BILA
MANIKRKHENEDNGFISTTWIINTEQLNNLKEGESLFDKKRIVSGMDFIQYYLEFCPNWNNKCRLYLHLKMEEGFDIAVTSKIVCKSADFNDYWQHIYKKSDGYGLPVCLADELFIKEKKFIVNHQLCISFEANLSIFKISDFPTKKPKIESFLGPKLWESENGKDAKIIVEGKEINVHKSVIECRSTIFNNVFCKSEPGMPISTSTFDSIRIDNYSINIVKRAVMFCYDKPYFKSLNDRNAIRLLKFASEFKMDDLKDKMEEMCVQLLDASNACIFANFSISCKAEKLYQKCFDFMLNCMKDGTPVKDIEKLDVTMSKELTVKTLKAS